MALIKVKVNGIEVEVPSNATVLEAARAAGVEIPTLCYLKDLNAIGACRICVTEVKGAKGLVAACVYPVSPNMEINTNSKRAFDARKRTLELILSNHRMECTTCVRSENCELQKLAKTYGLEEVRFGTPKEMEPDLDLSAAHLIRDNSKCILCRRCVAACRKQQGVAVIGPNDRGFATHIGSAFDRGLNEMACISCGQCINVCPTGALYEKDKTGEVWAALADPTKHVVVGSAPSVRAALGEEFGDPIGTNVDGKLSAALRRLGFDGVFDVNTAADLTIMEEGYELLGRLQNGGTLPLITSCSPGWIRFCEQYYPEFLPNLSSCKSPQQMFGAMMKSYYAKQKGIDPKDIFVVSVMPCTAKKYEVRRDDQAAVDGLYDIDATVTTRELARMIKKAGLNWSALPDEDYDPAFGVFSGAGVIFGNTGGVMEAALRTVADVVTGKSLDAIEYKAVRGLEGVKEASVTLPTADGKEIQVNVCVVSGTANAAKVLDRIKAGEASYQFIEVMCCPGGCINGGGQPIVPASVRNSTDYRSLRAAALYRQDADMFLRKSHLNPLIQKLYAEFLGEPNSHLAHELLHTSYTAKPLYPGYEADKA